jgi:hypothetical protein
MLHSATRDSAEIYFRSDTLSTLGPMGSVHSSRRIHRMPQYQNLVWSNKGTRARAHTRTEEHTLPVSPPPPLSLSRSGPPLSWSLPLPNILCPLSLTYTDSIAGQLCRMDGVCLAKTMHNAETPSTSPTPSGPYSRHASALTLGGISRGMSGAYPRDLTVYAVLNCRTPLSLPRAGARPLWNVCAA